MAKSVETGRKTENGLRKLKYAEHLRDISKKTLKHWSMKLIKIFNLLLIAVEEKNICRRTTVLGNIRLLTSKQYIFMISRAFVTLLKSLNFNILEPILQIFVVFGLEYNRVS